MKCNHKEEVIRLVLINQIRFGRQILPLTLVIMICVFLIGCGGKKTKVYRVGILSGAGAFVNIKDSLKDGMTKLGYVEGKNIVYDVQELNENPVGEQQVLKKFVADKVDLIFVFPTEPALAAKAATRKTNIPVVFAMGTIEDTGLVESVRQPGGNITGVRFNGPDVIVKGLEILLELAPNTKRIWIIHDTNYPAGISSMEALRSAASLRGVTLVETNVDSLGSLNAAIEARDKLSDIGIDAINLIPDVITLSPAGFAMISKFAYEHRVPICGGAAFAVRQGSVFTTIPDNVEMGRLAAPLVDKIFKGILAGTIPVVTPESHLHINYKRIQELGLEVSEGLLSRADEIIR